MDNHLKTWLCRVVLLDHEKHTEKTVVAAITTVIPGTSPEHALNCYNTAKKLGQAIITSCIKGACPACAAMPVLGTVLFGVATAAELMSCCCTLKAPHASGERLRYSDAC